MLIEILQHTPRWVFLLFFALLAFGYFQSKDRTSSRGRVSATPVAMIILSFYGVLSAFGVAPTGFSFWLLGVAIAVGLGVKLALPKGVTFSAETRLYFVPGSWLPLLFMMAIFFTKFTVNVVLARQLPVAATMAFAASVSLCYGLLSGILLARAIVIMRTATQHQQNDA